MAYSKKSDLMADGRKQEPATNCRTKEIPVFLRHATGHKPYALRFPNAAWAIRETAPHDGYEGDAPGLADQSRWITRNTTNAAQVGSQIHAASLART